MLTFATEFLIGHTSKAEDFLHTIKTWMLKSPHTAFSEESFEGILENGEFYVKNLNQQLRSISVNVGNEVFVAVNFINSDKDIDWNLEAVFHYNGFDAWVAIRIFRESESPVATLPEGKKPVLIRTLLETLGGGDDGGLKVQARPHLLTNDDVENPSNIILGIHSHHLPVVFISCNFRGGYNLDPYSLSADLSGMAHVLVEPNRAFSYRLQIASHSRNAFGGTVGIYWPDAAGRTSLFNIKDYSRPKDFKDDIVDTLRQSLLNRRPLYNCTWSAVQELFSKNVYERLKAEGSQNISEYIDAFDKDIKAKDQKLSNADREIDRLKAEIKKYEAQSASIGAIQLKIGNEQQFFEAEFSDMIIDILSESMKNYDQDSRRSHLLKDLIKNNPKTGEVKNKREAIKQILKSYTKMNAKIKSDLDELGFSITEDGKHFKAVYQDDGRYTFSISKSGSDHRSGMNLASDITKKIL